MRESEDFLFEIAGQDGINVLTYLRSVYPDLANLLLDTLYGNILQRDILTNENKFLCILSSIVAVGSLDAQLVFQTKLAMRNGVKIENIYEMLIVISPFCGIGKSINAMNVINTVVLSDENE